MQAIKIHTRTNNMGLATIQVNTSLPDSEVDLIVLVENEVRADDKSKKRKYDFSELAGRLEWKGDALELQRKIRSEWS